MTFNKKIGKALLLSTAIVAISFNANQALAQFTSATNSNYSVDFAACPSCGGTTTALSSINCDAMEYKPIAPANGSQLMTFGVVTSGGADGTFTNKSAAFIYNTKLAFQANLIHLEIPLFDTEFGYDRDSNGAVYVINDPDIAVGYYVDGGILKTFALIVYEYNGDIYLEAWGFDQSSNNNVASVIPTTKFYCAPLPGGTTKLCNIIGGNLKVNNNGPNAYYPHIDLITDHDDPNNALHQNVKFTISWEELNGGTARTEVYNVDGSILPTVGVGPSYLIAEGSQPDVAGVANYTYATAPGTTPPYDEDIIYTTYIDYNTGDLMMAERKYAVPTPYNYITLDNSADTKSYPRIAAPILYDFDPMINNPEPVAVVAANTQGFSGRYIVKSYSYNSPTNTPTVTVANVSDHNNPDFAMYNNDAMMPTVSGAGQYAANVYNGGGGPTVNDFYPVVYYSDYTWDGINNMMGTGNGDLFHVGIDPSSYNPVGQQDEVIFDSTVSANFSSSFSMTGTKPLLASSSTNNSNGDILVAYYTGSFIYYKYTQNTNYAFKPTNIGNVASGQEGEVYPNPVVNELFITKSAGAQYTVVDVTGKIMAQGTVSGEKYSINTGNYAQGMYIITLDNGDVVNRVKFVKQ